MNVFFKTKTCSSSRFQQIFSRPDEYDVMIRLKGSEVPEEVISVCTDNATWNLMIDAETVSTARAVLYLFCDKAITPNF